MQMQEEGEAQPLINRGGPVQLNEAPNMVLNHLSARQNSDCCGKTWSILSCGLFYSCCWPSTTSEENNATTALIRSMKEIRANARLDAEGKSGAVINLLASYLPNQNLSEGYRTSLKNIRNELIRRETPLGKMRRQEQEPDSTESKQSRYDNML